MKYLYQFLIIIGFTFVGEMLALLIPLPVPAAVYGLVLLFLALQTHIIKLEQVKTAGEWLVGIMGILFVAPTVNVMGIWDAIAPNLLSVSLITVISTVVVFAVAGTVTQLLTKKEEKGDA